MTIVRFSTIVRLTSAIAGQSGVLMQVPEPESVSL